jgi:2-methylcitrate dehydratase PrpD
MQEEHPFGANDVDKIVVHCTQATAVHVGWKYQPQGLTSAQLNLPYCVATLLLDGDVFVDQFSEDRVADPARMALAEKVDVREDPAYTAQGSKSRHLVRVEVQLKGGKKMERIVAAGRGNEHNFASEADVVAKFEKLAIHALPQAQVGELRDALLGIEKLADAGRIAELLALR